MKMVDWQEAVDICEKEGAFLASLLDEAENRFAAGRSVNFAGFKNRKLDSYEPKYGYFTLSLVWWADKSYIKNTLPLNIYSIYGR